MIHDSQLGRFVIQKPHHGQTIHLYPDHACNGLVKNGCIFNSIPFKLPWFQTTFGPSALPRIVIFPKKCIFPFWWTFSSCEFQFLPIFWDSSTSMVTLRAGVSSSCSKMFLFWGIQQMPMKCKFQPSVTFALVVPCLSFVIDTHWYVENTKTSKNKTIYIFWDIPNQMLPGSSPPGNHGNLRVAHPPPRNFQPAFERSFQGFIVLLHKKSCQTFKSFRTKTPGVDGRAGTHRVWRAEGKVAELQFKNQRWRSGGFRWKHLKPGGKVQKPCYFTDWA